jgi:hypothetical protein
MDITFIYLGALIIPIPQLVNINVNHVIKKYCTMNSGYNFQLYSRIFQSYITKLNRYYDQPN